MPGGRSQQKRVATIAARFFHCVIASGDFAGVQMNKGVRSDARRCCNKIAAASQITAPVSQQAT